MDFIIVGISGFLGCLLGAISVLIIAKKVLSTENIIKIAEELLEYVSTNEPMQKNVYGTGVLFGSGAIAGAGIGKGTGKMSFKGLLMEGFARLLRGEGIGDLGKMFRGQGAAPPGSPPRNVTPGQTEKLKSA